MFEDPSWNSSAPEKDAHLHVSVERVTSEVGA